MSTRWSRWQWLNFKLRFNLAARLLNAGVQLCPFAVDVIDSEELRLLKRDREELFHRLEAEQRDEVIAAKDELKPARRWDDDIPF